MRGRHGPLGWQCRDYNGSEPWACENCDCTERLERKLATLGDPFLKTLPGAD
jgi:hypothetical protein